ncbi:MAG TPA: MFS transporter [Steroidobacteraceae bacterium]|nr:MFS transporter [Steroidobacteraceae bacterium]
MANASRAPAAGDGLPVPRRYWAIAAIVLAIAMSVLDSSIANVALPTIAREMRTSAATSIWVVNAYQIAILVSLLPLAALGEIVGFRRISQSGLAVFTLASLACALAPSMAALTAARVVQGLGAAGIMSVNAALVRFTYPQRFLGRAVGINAFAVATSAAIGPTVASAVLAVASWRWLFAINGPVGIVTLLIATFALPVTERAARRLSIKGAALHAGAFGLLLSGLQGLAHHAGASLALLQITAGCALGVLLVRHEIARPAPLIPFDLLRIRLFALSIATSVCSFTGQMAALVALPFEIQRLGYSAVQTGLLMTPWPVAAALAAPLAGRLADRYPAGILCAVGLALLAVGLLLVGLLPVGAAAPGLIWRMALCGLGFGFFQSPNNRTLLLAAPRERSGAAGGMLGTARLLGQTVGAAGVAILFRVSPGRGADLALFAAAAVAFLAALVSTSRRAARPAVAGA